jgi:hypothetical protein
LELENQLFVGDSVSVIVEDDTFEWLSGQSSVSGVIEGWVTRTNAPTDMCVVRLDEPTPFVRLEEHSGVAFANYLFLALRYAGDHWTETAVVNMLVFSEKPLILEENVLKNAWVTPHARYKLVGRAPINGSQ